jgi:hypothetical protein
VADRVLIPVEGEVDSQAEIQCLIILQIKTTILPRMVKVELRF